MASGSETGASAGPTSNRVSTGHDGLDTSLQGGFPLGSAILLCAPAGDEALRLVGNFLKASDAAHKALFICRSFSSVRSLSETNAKNTTFLVCGERGSASNSVLAAKGLDNLTELSLDISEALNRVQPKRVAIDVISDILLRHGALQTRKWLSERLSRFRAKEITTIAVVNPGMHSQAEITAIVDLFDGNFEILEKGVNDLTIRVLRIKWMHGITLLETEPLVLGQVTAPLPAQPKPAAQSPNNLPTQFAPVIGRAKELAAAWPLVLRDEVRVLTLAGPGGIGKTTLALELARQLMDNFPDGVFLVPLASVNDPSLVISTMATTLGVKEEAGRALIESLAKSLEEKQMLLVLDNFEQVIAAAADVAELSNTCSKLKLLVTSREQLHIRGEREFPVPPLELPDLKRLPPLDALSENAAVTLFAQRAHAVRPDFEITHENMRAIAEICVRLDGLPLALELAAARIKILTPQTMLTRLENRLGLLTTGARDLPSRQQTLRNAIAWSYDLLDGAEKALFSGLSVFVGGFTLEAAETICADLSVEVIDGLSSLVDKSLVRRAEVNNEMRFMMLETIREYGTECLKATGQQAEFRQTHADFFLAMAEGERSHGLREEAWYNRLELEHDNLRSTLGWLAESGETERTLRLAGALGMFWCTRGHFTEGRKWLQSALSGCGNAQPRTRTRALRAAGLLAQYQGDYSQARSLYSEGISICRSVGEKLGLASLLSSLGTLARTEGKHTEAHSLAEESLAMYREAGDKRGIASSLNYLGSVAFTQGDYALARSLYQESLATFRELGDKQGVAASLINLGNIAHQSGDYAAAHSLLEESLAILREVGDKRTVASALCNLGYVAQSQGHHKTACSFYEEGLTIFQELGEKLGIANSFEGLAEAAKALGQAERAARLFAAAEVLREAIGAPMREAARANYETKVADVRAKLEGEAFAEAWAQGRAMGLEQAIAYALKTDSRKSG